MSEAHLPILVVDDERHQAEALARMLTLEGYLVQSTGDPRQALHLMESGQFGICVSDYRMPQMTGLDLFRACQERELEVAFIIVTAYGTIEQAVEAIREGVYDYVEKPVNLDLLQATLRRAEEAVRLRHENRQLRERVAALSGGATLIGDSTAMATVLERIAQVAPSEAAVLIRGESGTGKELAAQAIHDLSSRRDAPFVKVNCAAIPEGLLESELFGHVKGAFTGAVHERRGRFEQADRGTILLDEIGEMPLALQVKLLRVLQDKEVEPVGGDQGRLVDVRVLAATNRDLEALVRTGEFREDLYYRIHVIPIDLPPLRSREEDVRLLAEYFLSHFSGRHGRTFDGFTREALSHLDRHSWPGNVRELQNTMERAVVLARGREITAEDLQISSLGGGRASRELVEELLDQPLNLEALERELLRGALRRTGGNQTQAARLLGLSRRTLQYRAGKHALLEDAEGREEEPARP